MALPASPAPGRNTSGWSSDPPYGPLADSGMSNPFFYHQFSDDFDNALGVAGLYTVSNAGAGTIAHAAGDGGLALFTTAGANGNFESIQLPAASFVLPQGAGAGKKFFYLTRLQMSDIAAATFIAGVIATNATPFAAINDGVYFKGAASAINLISVVGGVATTTAMPLNGAYVNATNIDLGFYIDRQGNLNGFLSPNMVGWQPQSGTGSNLPTRGRVVSVSGLTFTALNMNLTLALQTNAAAVKTMTADFHLAQKER